MSTEKTVVWRGLCEMEPEPGEWCLVFMNDLVLPAKWNGFQRKFFGLSYTIYDVDVWTSMEDFKP